MTSILEKILATIAPNRCIVCSNYNNILCLACLHDLPKLDVELCLLCGKPSDGWRVCGHCACATRIERIFATSLYAGPVKELLHNYKFAHLRSAVEPLARLLCGALPHTSDEWLVVSVPTISKHIRQRGFDHAGLLAKHVADNRGLTYVNAVSRIGSQRQVGKNRNQRQKQAHGAFKICGNQIEGRKVLIIDDVCTTGATLKAVALALSKAGASEVWGAVVAWKE